MSRGDFLPADLKEDEEAGFMGPPFIEPEATTSGWSTCPGHVGRGPGRGRALVRLSRAQGCIDSSGLHV